MTVDDPTTRCPKCQGPLALDDLQCTSCGSMIRAQPLLGQILVDEEIVTQAQLEEGLRLQQRQLGEILVEIGACRPEDLQKGLKVQKLHRNRVDVYKGRLYTAIAVIAGLTLCLLVMLGNIFQQRAEREYLTRLQQGELSFEEVSRIMDEPASPHKFDALRSISDRLSHPSSVGLIGSALRNEKWYVRMYAVVLAKQTRSEALVPALIPLLEDTKYGLAPLAQDALTHLAGEDRGRSRGPWIEWARSRGIPVT